MIRCAVHLLRIFEMFHGHMNNPVYKYLGSAVILAAKTEVVIVLEGIYMSLTLTTTL